MLKHQKMKKHQSIQIRGNPFGGKTKKERKTKFVSPAVNGSVLFTQ
jgi:hypothetical protein